MGRGGEESFIITIKDSWTKPRGRVEVGEWRWGREVGLAGVGWKGGEKIFLLFSEQQITLAILSESPRY